MKSYFQLNNWKKWSLDILYIIIFILYAVGAAFLYNIAAPEKRVKLLTGIYSSLIFIPLIFLFFPSFSLKKTVVAPQYPQSRMKKALIDLLAFSLWKTIYLILLLFVVVFCCFLQNFDIQLFGCLLSYWLAGIFFAENLYNAISWQKYIYGLLTIMIAVFLFFLIHKIIIIDNSVNYLLAICIVIFICFYFLFYTSKPERYRKNKIADKYSIKESKWLYIKLLLRNKNLIIVMLMGFVFKIVLLSMFSVKIKTVDALIGKILPFLIFFSPIIIFTYVFDNIWGYFYSIQLNHIIINNSFRKELKTYFSLLTPVLLCDFLITIIMLLVYHSLNFYMIVFYIITLCYCISISLISAYTKYSLIIQPLNMTSFKGNTSPMYSILLIIPLMLVGVALLFGKLYFLLSLTALLVISICIFYYAVVKNYKTKLSKKIKTDLINNGR